MTTNCALFLQRTVLCLLWDHKVTGNGKKFKCLFDLAVYWRSHESVSVLKYLRDVQHPSDTGRSMLT